jgi:flagellar hook-associated protein 2
MAIGFSGIGAGTDWTGIISQLLQIESRPLNQLLSREQELNEQISDFALVKSSFSNFQSALDDLRTDTGFAPYTGTSSDEDVATATASSDAAAASYSLVVSQLASYDKIASSTYADSDTAVGTGTLSITVDGTTLDVTVDGTNNTLSGLVNAINSDAGNPGVTASIINEVGGSRLILTSDETGAANAISISFTDDDGNNTDDSGLSRLFYIGSGGDGLAEQVATAADAELTIDGFDVTSASNSVADALTGVTLQLAATGSATITIERDDAQIQENVQGFVDAYNTLLDQLDDLGDGSLATDTGLRRMEQGLVDILNQAASIDGSDAYLFEAGIERDKEGRLSLDSTELTEALAADFDKIVSLFSDETEGFAVRMYDYVDQLLDTDGVIASREEGLDSRLTLLQEQIDRQERHLDVVEKTLIAQFQALDVTVSALQSTSDYLAGQLSNLLNNS